MAERTDHFQVVRGVACLMVVYSHIGGTLLEFLPKGQTVTWVTAIILPTGFNWVWVFLVLSGYLLTKGFVEKRFALDTEGIRKFYRSRAFRLLPVLWFVFLVINALYLLGFWSHWLSGYVLRKEFYAAIALPWAPYIGSSLPVNSVNAPVWSVVLEIHFCIVLPILLYLTSGRRWPFFAAFGIWLTFLVWLAYSVVTTGQPEIFPALYADHRFNVGFFLAGMLLSFAPVALKDRTKAIPWPIMICAVALAMYFTQYLALFRGGNYALAVCPFFVLPVAVLLVARCDDTYQAKLIDSVRDLLRPGTPLAFLERAGMMSYSIYLVHTLAVLMVIDHLDLGRFVADRQTFLGTAILAAAPTLAVCAGVYLLVEARFRRGLPWRRDLAPITAR